MDYVNAEELERRLKRMEESRRTVAVWESRGGAYRLELTRDYMGFNYRGTTCSGGWPSFGWCQSAECPEGLRESRKQSARLGALEFGRRLKENSFHGGKLPMRRIK